MKKKLLSLVLAGAMVASTSVSAFAEANTKNVNVFEGKESTTQIDIKGDIYNRENKPVAGTVTVTVPTSTTFTVDKDGVLTAPDIVIRNNGEETVSVIAESFNDSTAEDKINIVSESEFALGQDGVDRKKVSLKLIGENTYHLKSVKQDDEKGIYKANGDKAEENPVLGNVRANDNLTIKVEGKAGKKDDPLTEAVTDNFQLVLKLKKEK